MPRLRPDPSVRITYVGGPTALLEFSGLRFLTDPTFDPPGGSYATASSTLHKTAGPAVSSDALLPLDAVLLSHDHNFDNFDHAGRALLSRAQRVLTTPAGAARLGGSAVGLGAWRTIDLTSPAGPVVRISGAPARHGPAGGDRGPVTGFVITAEDAPEFGIYVSGDTVWYD